MEALPRPQLPRPISRILFQGCPEEVQIELLSKIPIHAGATLSEELLESTLQATKAFNGRFEILVRQAVRREEFLNLSPEIRRRLTPPACDDGVNVTIYDPASLPRRIRIEGNVQESMLIRKVAPVYPRRTGEDQPDEGAVTLSVVVGKDGSVINVDPVAGPEFLIDPVVDAVKQWKYRPTLLNGFPVEVQTQVEVRLTPDR